MIATTKNNKASVSFVFDSVAIARLLIVKLFNYIRILKSEDFRKEVLKSTRKIKVT